MSSISILTKDFLLTRLGPSKHWQSDALSRLFSNDSTSIFHRLAQLWGELPENAAGCVVKHRILLCLLTIPLKISLSRPSNQTVMDAARALVVLGLKEQSENAKLVRLTASFVVRLSPCLDPLHSSNINLEDFHNSRDDTSGDMELVSSSSSSSSFQNQDFKSRDSMDYIAAMESLVSNAHAELDESVDRIVDAAEKHMQSHSSKGIAALSIDDVPLSLRLQPHTAELLRCIHAGAPSSREDAILAFQDAEQGVPIDVSTPISQKLGLPLSSAAFSAVTTSLAQESFAVHGAISSHICLTQSALQAVKKRAELFERVVSSRSSLEIGDDGVLIETEASRAALRDIRSYLHPGKAEKKASSQTQPSGHAIGMMKISTESTLESQQQLQQQSQVQQQPQQSYKRKRAVLEGIEVDAKLISALGDASSAGLTSVQRTVVESFANGKRSMVDFESAKASLGILENAADQHARSAASGTSGTLDLLSGKVTKNGKLFEVHLILDYNTGRWTMKAQKPNVLSQSEGSLTTDSSVRDGESVSGSAVAEGGTLKQQ